MMLNSNHCSNLSLIYKIDKVLVVFQKAQLRSFEIFSQTIEPVPFKILHLICISLLRRCSYLGVVVEVLIMSMNGKVENQLHWGSLATKYPTLHEYTLSPQTDMSRANVSTPCYSYILYIPILVSMGAAARLSCPSRSSGSS